MEIVLLLFILKGVCPSAFGFYVIFWEIKDWRGGFTDFLTGNLRVLQEKKKKRKNWEPLPEGTKSKPLSVAKVEVCRLFSLWVC